MPVTATIVNALWTGSNLPSYWRFRFALRQPQIVQSGKLRELIEQNRNTAFGKAHGFDEIKTHEEFTNRVPLSDYTTLAPWVARIRQGESNVLTAEPVTRLVPTSGSSGARKLIPFTAGLQREFNAGIGPWLVDLTRRNPAVIGGRAYWSITPALAGETAEESVVPIGFDTDTAYLGGVRRKLAAATLVAPACLTKPKSIEEFHYETLLCLLRCRDLRLISVWHPSFLTLLLDALPKYWQKLIGDIEGGAGLVKNGRRRAGELRAGDPLRPKTLWPDLRVISCWGDGAASLALSGLRIRFPGHLVQPKGLIATEGFVTLPFSGQHPLAVTSHFFEFIDPKGNVYAANALREGGEYEVVLSTAGGLWRYRLGDRVVVTGFLENTPSLRFLGRGENLSDRFGEKLSEEFVIESLREVFGQETPPFALLAPDESEAGCRYTLYVEGFAQPRWASGIDRALRRNPHYSYCRDLGQLLPSRVFLVSERGYETFARRHAAIGTRLGDVKPNALSRISGWSAIFSGTYMDQSQTYAVGRVP